ncbi:sensor histidine kinase [Flavobacterium frigoris]|uniref:histidine kinase n=1 Tax=Flavobacterium frigoris (strain PS1) TaxID=1086011 RepID=H7FLG7_FLAFP|nr:histidine kinase [Flavobacterium frigoris]EIA10509.1 two component sensor histidine kinase [Flavobacterium frigoris PS1]
MKINPAYEKELVLIILYSSLFFIVVAIVLVVFFYYSRKKIIQKEVEKRSLVIQHQREQLRAVIITQEDERKRIAQDLHDDISSKLNIVSLNSYLLNTPNLLDNEISEITKNIIDLVGKALENTRRIAHDLLPPVFDQFGLDAGVEELCLEFICSKAVQVNYKNEVEFDKADNDRHLHVFRILQELMNNSLRHGKAKNISVLFENINGGVNCRYSDDGVGFDVNSKENKNGLGMKNIESRVDLLNGMITFESELNKGIQVVFNF